MVKISTKVDTNRCYRNEVRLVRYEKKGFTSIMTQKGYLVTFCYLNETQNILISNKSNKMLIYTYLMKY